MIQIAAKAARRKPRPPVIWGPALRELRKALTGTILEPAANQQDWHDSTLSKIENGQMSPHLYEALKKWPSGWKYRAAALFTPHQRGKSTADWRYQNRPRCRESDHTYEHTMAGPTRCAKSRCCRTAPYCRAQNGIDSTAAVRHDGESFCMC